MISYYTHDNGSRPFEVTLEKKKAIIKVQRIPELGPYEDLLTLKFNKMWMGDDPEEDFKGNSFLFQVSTRKYVFIGTSIMEFELPVGEKVERFVGHVGNSDVVYPYAETNKRVLFFIEFTEGGFVSLPLKVLSDHDGGDYYNALYNEKSLDQHKLGVPCIEIEGRPEKTWRKNHTKRQRQQIMKKLQKSVDHQ